MTDIMRTRPRSLMRTWDWPFRRFFEDFLGTHDELGWLPELWSEGRFVPAIDVTEDKEAVTLTAEIPGMSREDLEVTVQNGMLSLRGEKKEEETIEDADYRRTERRYGHFERQIRLPDYVDAERIEATYKDGVLKLRMPRAETAKARAIKIKGE